MHTNFTHYLQTKRSVDDRALNRSVCEQLRNRLPDRSPLRLLEIGAGSGAQFARLARWGLYPPVMEATLLDADPQPLQAVTDTLAQLAADLGLQFTPAADGGLLHDEKRRWRVRTVTAEALPWLAARPASWGLLVAHALLDLLNAESALPVLLEALQPGGAFYFTLVFDGVTLFEPSLPQDDRVLAAYHASMDARGHGGSRSGREWLRLLSGHPAVTMLAAGASDWIVLPQDGRYPAEEAAFLGYILDAFADALTGRLPDEVLVPWLATRRQQVAAGQLIFVAHQYDLAGIRR